MNRLLLFLILIFSASILHAQSGYLFVKKGAKKKKTYEEGDRISLQLSSGGIFSGVITLLKDDTIYLSGVPIPRAEVKTVLLPRKKKEFNISSTEILLVTAGAALTTVGLAASKQADFGEALTAGLVIGFGPLLLHYAGSKISFKRKRYRIGKKFRLQVLDFHIPTRRPF